MIYMEYPNGSQKTIMPMILALKIIFSRARLSFSFKHMLRQLKPTLVTRSTKNYPGQMVFVRGATCLILQSGVNIQYNGLGVQGRKSRLIDT